MVLAEPGLVEVEPVEELDTFQVLVNAERRRGGAVAP
jgi:hypothetical protein